MAIAVKFWYDCGLWEQICPKCSSPAFMEELQPLCTNAIGRNVLRISTYMFHPWFCDSQHVSCLVSFRKCSTLLSHCFFFLLFFLIYYLFFFTELYFLSLINLDLFTQIFFPLCLSPEQHKTTLKHIKWMPTGFLQNVTCLWVPRNCQTHAYIDKVLTIIHCKHNLFTPSVLVKQLQSRRQLTASEG